MEKLPLKDNKPYQLKLEIGNQTYEIDIKFLLHLRSGVTEDKSSIELEETLEKMSGYLHIISQAYKTASIKTKKLETQFESWYNDKYVETEKVITQYFKQEVNSGSRSKTKMQPTQKQIESRMIANNKSKWKRWNERIKKSQIEEEFLYREFKLLQSRSTHIQSILSLRKQILPSEGVK